MYITCKWETYFTSRFYAHRCQFLKVQRFLNKNQHFTVIKMDLIKSDFIFNPAFYHACIIFNFLRRLQGQLSVLPNLTNSPKLFHIIKDFNLNIKTIFKSTSFKNLLQLRVLHIKSKLKLEKKKLNNNYNVKRNRKHIDIIKLE